MIDETTWHRDPDKQTRFEWSATSEGIQLEHNNGNPPHLIPWSVFYAVFQYAGNMTLETNGVVTAGMSQTNPTAGSVGEWVFDRKMSIPSGVLTPRHLSFIGPILGRMGFITRQIKGNSIYSGFSIEKMSNISFSA